MARHDPAPLAAEPAATVTTPELLKLLTFLSPAFPVGAFSYSHGLEWLIDSRMVATAEDLQTWLGPLLESGSLWNDAVIFAEAYRAASAEDAARLDSVAELGEMLAGSRERHLEAMAQGRAFLDAVSDVWPGAMTAHLSKTNGASYAVAVATVAADHGIALASALPAYLNALVASLVSVGVRLVPIGQAAGLRLIAALHPAIAATAERALRASLDDLGSATILFDIASMRHETQYSRVFRT